MDELGFISCVTINTRAIVDIKNGCTEGWKEWFFTIFALSTAMRRMIEIGVQCKLVDESLDKCPIHC